MVLSAVRSWFWPVLKESVNVKTMLVHGFTSMKIRLGHARNWAKLEGPLHGIPVGIKDILDTRDMPTCYSSPIYDGHKPVTDSSCVSFLRNAGAVILGKPSLPNLPGENPGRLPIPIILHSLRADLPAVLLQGWLITWSPWPLEPRPGDLSFGRHLLWSGRFQADFRTSFGGGVKPLSHSLDTLGCFVRSAEDLRIFRQAI